MLALSFPSIDPVAIQLGPLAIRWYGLAYLVGMLGAWRCAFWLLPAFPMLSKKHVEGFLTWALAGVIVGGRLGYVLFYRPDYYMHHLLEIFETWKGGMSFHGGLLGVSLAFILYCRKQQIPVLVFADLMCCGIPIGLFFGRLANFVNQELWGRVTMVPWAVLFPAGGGLPRHPSQLYEAFLEGIILFSVLMLAVRCPGVRHRWGTLTGIFLTGYAVCRVVVECFREPDAFLGFFWGGITMGQVLSLPLGMFGLYLLVAAKKTKV